MERREQFKKLGDSDAARRSRQETTVAIRKAKKEEQIIARRKMESGASEAGGGGGGSPAVGGVSGKTQGLSEKMQERLALLPQMVAGIYSNDRQLVHQCTEQIRRLLSIERKPPIEEVIATGIVPRLVEFIKQDESHELQFEAAWALTNIASGTTHHTRVVIDAGAVPIFTQLLQSPSADVREQAIWALGNIAGDHVKYRNMVLEMGAMPLLLNQLMQPNNKMSVLRNGTWTLSNFCRGKPPPPFSDIFPALEVLARLVQMTDEDVITDACWALSYISDGSGDKIDAIIGSGVCPRLVELLVHPSEAVQTPALRAIGNIVTGTDAQTQMIVNLGALQCLVQLLGARKWSIVKEACWTISNITAGSPQQVQAVIDSHLIPPLIALLETSDFDVRKEAAWAVSNATAGGQPDQIRYLVQQGCIRPFCDLLTQKDHNLVLVALEGLENMLKVGLADLKAHPELIDNPFAKLIDEAGGIDKIEALQSHKEDTVHQRALKIIDTYFGQDETPQFVPTSGMIPPQAGGLGGPVPPAAGGQWNYSFQFNTNNS